MSGTSAPSRVWTDEDERRANASFAAFLTRKLGFGLHGTIAALLIPVVGTGIIGIFLLAAIAVMVVVIPFRSIWWHRRLGAVEPEHPDMVGARRMLRQALALWAASPVSFVLYAVLAYVIYRPLRHL